MLLRSRTYHKNCAAVQISKGRAKAKVPSDFWEKSENLPSLKTHQIAEEI